MSNEGPDERSQSDVNDLKSLDESYSTDLNLRIMNVRARQLTEEGRVALHGVLLDMTNRILGESAKRATADDRNASGLIQGEHISVARTTVVKDLAVLSSRKNRWQSALESIGVGAALACVPALYDHHLYFALGFIAVTALCMGTLYVCHTK